MKEFTLEYQLVNLTPHTISIFNKETEDLIEQVQPSGTVARAGTSVEVCDPMNGIPIVKTSYKQVEGLPAPQPYTYYLVSGLVKAAASDRFDLLQPSDLKRDEKGRVVGCYALSF